MKVLLTTLNAKYIHSSLALRYLEKYCMTEKYDIAVEEYTINEYVDYITADIYKKHADIVAFSCYIWNITMIYEIADRLKKVKPEIIIILGGPEVSFDAMKTMEEHRYVDFIIKGEGEQTLKELLDNIEKSEKDYSKIRGIIYRTNNEQIIENSDRSLIQNLDSIPFPYNKKDLDKLSGKLIYYESSRGCPFNCSYCLSSTIRGVRYFSFERVKKDLLFLIDNNVKLIKFVDRTFNCNKKRTMKIFKFLIENIKNTSFHFEIVADLLDDEMIDFLSKVPKGLFQFEIGVQSTNPYSIKAVNRKMDFAKLSQKVMKLRQCDNIHLHLDLIAGLPGEDYRSFTNSFNDVYSINPHVLQLGFLKLLKGSKIREEVSKYNYKYTQIPPYEVLENHVMSYGEILKLKAAENILEKFHNSQVFKKSLNFVLNNFYSSPFKFFEEFAEYFESKGLNKVSHSRKALYDIFFEFYEKTINKDIEIFSEYLKFDFWYFNKGAALPYWMFQYKEPNFKEKTFEFLKEKINIKKYLPNFIDTAAKNIIKKVKFEIFNIDILNNTNDISQTVVLFDYTNKNKVKVYDVTKEFGSINI